MEEITIKNGANDLPGDIKTKIASKLGSNIFLVQKVVEKVEALKNPITIRSYSSLPINKAEIHTGEGNVRGLRINNDTFLHAKNVKIAGGQESKSDSNSNNGGNENEKVLFIAFNESDARKASVDANTIELARVRNIIKLLTVEAGKLEAIIEADGGVK